MLQRKKRSSVLRSGVQSLGFAAICILLLKIPSFAAIAQAAEAGVSLSVTSAETAPENPRGTEDASSKAVAVQPLAANVSRLLDAMEYLGSPLPEKTTMSLRQAIRDENGSAMERLLRPHVLLHVSINPELRVKVRRGDADPLIRQAGYTPLLMRVENEATLTRSLRISSPQAGPSYAGTQEGILLRQAQTELKINENLNGDRRFLQMEMFDQSPMTSRLSGFHTEYLLALIYSSEPGQLEATIAVDVGEGTQDLGFRSEVPILFTIEPAVPVRVFVTDHDGTPTTARIEIRDAGGRVYPPQARRLAPDFFFQPQIYRSNGDVVLLPPGTFQVETSRGPEYLRQVQTLEVALPELAQTEATGSDSETVSASEKIAADSGRTNGAGSETAAKNDLRIQLKRWIDPSESGFRSGDHHIHGAGCSHYESPTQGVTPADMFRQVKGEGLNVGCVLTWGPCFDHQRNFFSPVASTVSEPLTLLKYDLEISGFGSAALGHVCLLNLRDQTYPGSDGTKTQGWPTWTVPVMRWAREQGGVTGYPHSALTVDPGRAADWLLKQYDQNADGVLNPEESSGRLLPDALAKLDSDRDKQLSRSELLAGSETASQRIPNTALPGMDGGGAMEIFVSTAEGVCDFISAMDTARIPEWNTWYHLMNCGFPLKLSGETDFPCMSSRRVGQGRVYVQVGDVSQIDFTEWCRGLAAGRSYVSDGYAHAPDFRVNDIPPGTSDVLLESPQEVVVEASVAFSPELPRAVAYGTLEPSAGTRMVGDTINLHAPRDSGYVQGGERVVELIMNGEVVAKDSVPADGAVHTIRRKLSVSGSSWIALRQFPQLHTNPVRVLVGNQPIRASRSSAVWCAESVRMLWANRRRFISDAERPDAREAYLRTLQKLSEIFQESGGDQSLKFPVTELEQP
ncbi:MAG: CehA/McbA family metallohydrolase [Planctomyces sp.]